MMPINVVIADDDALIRDSLKLILDLDSDIAVVGTCLNGDEAYNLCSTISVDVVLMDIRMPVCDGIIGTKKIKNQFSHINVLVLTTFQDEEYIMQALKNGASGYILKNTPSTTIREYIKIVNKGALLIHPEIAAKLKEMLNVKTEKDLSKYNLTPREIQIIQLISDGYSNTEIVKKLFLSESTIKNYVSTILTKLNLRDRTQVAVFYLKRNL
ncbi:response regulator transcription factor [Clostridium akagii]|uniref:response regulator transcription factor n=1 Tax=Clostridium akagii TaxID=91623 RepID=UPI001A9A465A|nr:response regulator transcription factor [Clostridium akagii]